MNTPSPGQIERAMSAAMQVKAQLGDDPDEKLVADCIDGETDVFTVIDRLTEAAIADKQLVEMANARAKRIEARAERARMVIAQMMEALQLTKLERPLVTLSIAHHAKALVTDADALPPEFIRHAPDLVAIRKALTHGETVRGAELGNPAPRLILRTA